MTKSSIHRLLFSMTLTVSPCFIKYNQRIDDEVTDIRDNIKVNFVPFRNLPPSYDKLILVYFIQPAPYREVFYLPKSNITASLHAAI
jgi:hypothetical protein